MEFIDAKEVKLKKEKVNYDAVDKFIISFNKAISTGVERGDGSFHLNNFLDNIPTLNDSEFDLAVQKAHLRGWVLTRYDDNYNTISYKMIKNALR